MLSDSYSKCSGKDCPRKEQCFRYTKPPLPKYQHWIVEIVSIPDKNNCRFFIQNKDEGND